MKMSEFLAQFYVWVYYSIAQLFWHICNLGCLIELIPVYMYILLCIFLLYIFSEGMNLFLYHFKIGSCAVNSQGLRFHSDNFLD